MEEITKYKLEHIRDRIDGFLKEESVSTIQELINEISIRINEIKKIEQ